MTTDEQAIVDLTRDNARLRKENQELREEITHAEISMSKAGIPSGFEDGNSYDDYSFAERLTMLCNLAKKKGT